VPSRGRRGDQRSREPGDHVADHDERLLGRRPIRDVARGELQETRRRLREPFDEAEKRGPRSERSDEDRQEREDHLRADVGKKARDAERDDRPRKSRIGGRRCSGPFGQRTLKAGSG
jgi:hypothetical protein